jgi:ribosomal protein L40E
MARKTIGFVHLEWTCPNCETRNPGPHRFCNGCGAPQPEDIQFEQPAQEKLIQDQAEIARAKAGPDVHCPYCKARNPGGAKFCGACGGDLSEAAVRESGRVVGAHRAEPVPDVTCPSCGARNPATARTCQQCGASMPGVRAEIPTMQPTEKMPARRRSTFGVAAIALLVVCILGAVGLVLLLNRTEDITGKVQAVSWTRSIPILALGLVEHEDWLEDIPHDAEIGDCRLEYHHTQDEPADNSQEVCGTPYTVDTGGGFGEVVQDCVYEVYEDWCTYSEQDWQVVDQVTLSGSDLNPVWPQVNLGADQRQGDGEEEYEVTFQSDQGTYLYTITDPVQFSQFVPGSEWLLKVNPMNAVLSVEPYD